MQAEASSGRAIDQLRRFYDQSAPGYDRWMRYYDRLLLGDRRARICSLASGQTLELAVGTGLNLAWYPPGLPLTGIDLSPAMLAVARRRAERLGRAVDLRLGDAQALDFPDRRFDTVVATLLLSTIPDCQQAAAEARRVLRPGGRLLLLDHVRSPAAPVRWLERLLDPLLARRTGVHLLREPVAYLPALGFTIERLHRSKGGIIEELVARRAR